MLEGKNAFNEKTNNIIKPKFFVKFEAKDEDFDENSQSLFLKRLDKFSEDNNIKARMMDETETEYLRPGVNILVKMTGSMDPRLYSKIIDSFIKVLNKTYPKLLMERENEKETSDNNKDEVDKELEDMVNEFEDKDNNNNK